jgi:hypothetical protein
LHGLLGAQAAAACGSRSFFAAYWIAFTMFW